MRQGIEELERFYAGTLGCAARDMAVRRLHALWPQMDGLDVLSYGYGIPYLKAYEGKAHRLIYAMPRAQGVARYQARRGNSTLVVGGCECPFPPSTFDRVLITHGLEETPNLPALLSQMWRVMKPEGRIVIITANRAGLWARSDKTPFGAGRPFSRRQLSNVLRQEKFTPLVRAGALYSPPLKALCVGRRAKIFETFGETVWPEFSGLVLVEAVKRLYARRGRAQKAGHRTPKFSGAGALGASHSTNCYKELK